MKKLPDIYICDEPFSIDTRKQRLEHREQPDRFIRFRELKEEGEFLSGLFSNEEKDFVKDSRFVQYGDSEYTRIVLPVTLLKDFESLSEKDISAINKASSENNWGIEIPEGQAADIRAVSNREVKKSIHHKRQKRNGIR